MKNILIYLSLCLVLASCSSSPEPIAFGRDQCAFCKMTIADPKFGAELITDKGRVLKYDALECMLNHIKKDAPAHKTLLAVAYDKPEALHPVEQLSFIISPQYKSPMGANLAAFSDTSDLPGELQPDTLDWNNLLNRFKARKN